MKKNLQQDRRDFLKMSTALGLGTATWAHLPWLANKYIPPSVASLYDQFSRSALAQSVDGFQYLIDAARGGLSLLRFSDTAQAAVEEEIYYVNINVTCGIGPKFFTIFEAENVAGLTNGMLQSGKITDSKTYLTDTGIEKLTTIDRWKNMRMTEWFSKILMNGTNDGLPVGATNAQAEIKPYIAPFPDDVNIQVAHGLTGGTSHIFSSFLLGSNTRGDINFELERGGFYSPLQILCFGTGGVADDLDPNSGDNRVQGIGGAIAVPPKTTTNFLSTVNQLVADSYISTKVCGDTAADNIICQFDKLSKSAEALTLRKTMLDNLIAIREAIASMGPNVKKVVDATVARSDTTGAYSTGRSAKTTKGPSIDFLSQVTTVCELVKNLDAYRNFSLHLNLIDLDGAVYDSDVLGEARPHGHNYVSGHRQLAIALNMLAKLIKTTNKKIYVTIGADTGRALAAVDAAGGVAVLMAPASTKLKDSVVYFNETALTANGGAAADPSSSPDAWGKALKKGDGTPDNTSATPYKAWCAGVFKFILGKRLGTDPYVEIETTA